ncbi:hypothetical protein KCP69_11560 [Salmonella enterica subsp. enterica]|nr:hypothetical protein KCP69_11560 [Salmonella enterica subsp. enterica]
MARYLAALHAGDGQGNFGSIDGDSAAAMRYTEIRLAKNRPRTDGRSEKKRRWTSWITMTAWKIPDVMPTVPNLLVNGSSGIAVGMATNIPPHNLTEVINGCPAYIDNEDISTRLMEHIPGPGLPDRRDHQRSSVSKKLTVPVVAKCTSCARAEVEADAKTAVKPSSSMKFPIR